MWRKVQATGPKGDFFFYENRVGASVVGGMCTAPQAAAAGLESKCEVEVKGEKRRIEEISVDRTGSQADFRFSTEEDFQREKEAEEAAKIAESLPEVAAKAEPELASTVTAREIAERRKKQQEAQNEAAQIERDSMETARMEAQEKAKE